MSIEKMEYVNISGEEKELDTVLEKLSECGCFHIESAGGSKIKAVSSQREENPYNGILSEISEIWTMTRMKSESVQLGDSFKDNISENEKYIFGIRSFISSITLRTAIITGEFTLLPFPVLRR